MSSVSAEQWQTSLAELLGEASPDAFAALSATEQASRVDAARQTLMAQLASPSPRLQRQAEKRLQMLDSVATSHKPAPSPTPAVEPPSAPRAAVPAAVSGPGPALPIQGLISRYSPPHIILQWDWPGDAEMVRVCWTWDRVPQDAMEASINFEDVDRARYEAVGGFRLRTDLRHPHHFAVFSRPSADLDIFGPQASVVEPTGVVRDVRYEVVVQKKWGFLRIKRVFIRFTVDKSAGRADVMLGEIMVVAKPTVPAVEPSGGYPVLQQPALSFSEEGQVEIDIPRKFWKPDMFARVFFTGGQAAQSARLYRLLPGPLRKLKMG